MLPCGSLPSPTTSNASPPRPHPPTTRAQDLGNLLAYDSHPVDLAQLRRDPEAFLRESARDNVQLLISRVFNLPHESSEVGPLVVLPQPTTRLPRAKPVPKPRAPTRWETFAKSRGIAPKAKRERMVWDETHSDWRPRFGYGRVDNGQKDWVIEVKDGMDPYADHFAALKADKTQRLLKNRTNQLNNIERAEGAGGKRKRHDRDGGGGGGSVPVGIPTQLGKAIGGQTAGKRIAGRRMNDGKGEIYMGKGGKTKEALGKVQRSTASLGRFDKKLAHEPDAPRIGKRRQRMAVAGASTAAAEHASSMKLLDRVLAGKNKNVGSAAPTIAREDGKRARSGYGKLLLSSFAPRTFGARYLLIGPLTPLPPRHALRACC